MKYRVRLTAKAERDVDSVLRWFREQRATTAGERWFRRLLATIATLETRPHRCSVASESDELGLEVRELVFGRRQNAYRILFRIEKRTVDVLRVWHSARDRLSPPDL